MCCCVPKEKLAPMLTVQESSASELNPTTNLVNRELRKHLLFIQSLVVVSCYSFFASCFPHTQLWLYDRSLTGEILYVNEVN